jgi:hypothetical protein
VAGDNASAYVKRVCGRGQTHASQRFGGRTGQGTLLLSDLRFEHKTHKTRVGGTGTVNSAFALPKGSNRHSPCSEPRPHRHPPDRRLPTSTQDTEPGCSAHPEYEIHSTGIEKRNGTVPILELTRFFADRLTTAQPSADRKSLSLARHSQQTYCVLSCPGQTQALTFPQNLPSSFSVNIAFLI